VQCMRPHTKRARFASRLVIDKLFTAVTCTTMTTCKLLITLGCVGNVIWRRPRLQVLHEEFMSSTCHSLQQGKHKLFPGLTSYCHASTAGTLDTIKLVKYCQPKVVSMPCTAERQTGQFFSLCKCLSKHALQNLLCMHGSS